MSKSRSRIGVDLMGSDLPPAQLFAALTSLPPLDFDLVLFGSEEFINRSSFPLHVCSTHITMADNPAWALKHKRDSSLYQGLLSLRQKKIDALISLGNTGALFLAAKTLLPPLPQIDRPAILTLLPTKKHELALLDVGAGTSAKPAHLLQFALMGIAYQKSRGVANPRVGLLNIGKEPGKGPPALREAHKLLSQLGPVFVGNVEGRDVFQGQVDVLVTDGFTGNVFLKTAEGMAAFIRSEITDLKLSLDKFHYAKYPGALLCGIDGLVLKCHGEGHIESLTATLSSAHRLLEHGFLDKLKTHLPR